MTKDKVRTHSSRPQLSVFREFVLHLAKVVQEMNPGTQGLDPRQLTDPIVKKRLCRLSNCAGVSDNRPVLTSTVAPVVRWYS